ncbi:MAG: 1-acyl-sn-glycerol-3-phosphate acyltransferase [Aridibacter famidurans]|nr:1-acyl-sn-glycerol-3-phosphate acyltransferase [Aridibacter famidurans]
MPVPDVRELRLGDMVFNRRGSAVRQLIHAFVSLSLRLFFRRIETLNASVVPYSGPLIFVMNHPNGLIDPSLVFVALPRKVSFLAKSTLFKIPVLASMLRTVEALPVFRKIDDADVGQNVKTFDASHSLLKRGGAIALFPEGVSHNSPKLLPIKTGAARIALGAISGFENSDEIHLKIIPVGLYYTSKTRFRSEALIYFGEAMEIEPVELEKDGGPPRNEVRELTDRIEGALREVTVNAETGAEIDSANEAANLFLSVTETLDLEESLAARFEFVRKFLDNSYDESPETLETREITGMISGYKKKLRVLGLEPENLSLSKHPFWYVFQHFIFRVAVLTLVLPLSAAGFVLHLPAYQIGRILGERYSKHGADDIVSTVKIAAGIVLMPVTWVVTGIVVGWLFGWRFGLPAVPLAGICGYAAMKSLESLTDLRGWFRAVVLFFRRRDLFIELLIERRDLHRKLSG